MEMYDEDCRVQSLLCLLDSVCLLESRGRRTESLVSAKLDGGF